MKVVFILGMGRSGTSALTRTLSLCGATLPELLLGANPANPKGHWEPIDALNLNDELLFQHGSSWYDPSLRLQGETPLDGQRSRAYADRIEAFLARCPKAAALVIKEPRITALADLWFAAARRCDLSIGVVVAIRHPQEVCASLVARDGVSAELASALWLKYNLLAERQSRHVSRVFVDYSSLLQDWRRQITRIEQALSVELPVTDSVVVEEFLSQDLQHHHNSGGVFDAFGQRWVPQVYGALSAAAQDEPLNERSLDEVYDSYRVCEHAFRVSLDDFRTHFGPPGFQKPESEPQVLQPSDAIERKIAAMVAQGSERERLLREEITSLAERLSQAQTDAAQSRTEAAQSLKNVAAQIRSQQEYCDRQLAMLSNAFEKHLSTQEQMYTFSERKLVENVAALQKRIEIVIEELHETVERHSSGVREHAESVERKLLHHVGEQRASLEAKLAGEIGAASARLDVIATQQVHLGAQLSAQSQHFSERELHLRQELCLQQERLEERLADELAELLGRLTDVLAHLDGELQTVQRSMGWRLSAPVRAIAGAFGSKAHLPKIPIVELGAQMRMRHGGESSRSSRRESRE